jgi:hypothetical protein
MYFCQKCEKIANVVNESLNRIICTCGFSKVILEGENVSLEEKIPKQANGGEGAIEKKHDLKGFPHTCRKC